MTYGYSLCEIMEITECKDFLIPDHVEYVYMGSEFCDQYYVGTGKDLWERCFEMVKKEGKKGILVIPVPSQKRLETVKERTDFLLNTYNEWIYEIVVNDFSMLQRMACIIKKPLWCGRMLSKEPRDPRHMGQKQIFKLYERAKKKVLFGIPVKGVEIDCLNLEGLHLEDSCIAGIHVPYAYVSMSRICEIGSIGYEMDQKFRLTNMCKRQCLSYFQEYFNNNSCFLKFGQSVYTDNRNILESISQYGNSRIIYSAVSDWIKHSKEDLNSEITCSSIVT